MLQEHVILTLLIEDEIVNNNLLTIPHPSMHLREFVLIPFYGVYRTRKNLEAKD